jgi:hypothetical protein
MPLSVLNGPVIAAGESLSAGLDCTGGRLVRITMSFVWASANISFQISTDGNGYNDLFTVDGKEIVIPVIPGTAVVLAHLGDSLNAIQFLKIRSGTRSWPVIQPAQAEFAVAVEVP